VESKLIGAGLIAGATWVAYNRLSEPTPFYSPSICARGRVSTSTSIPPVAMGSDRYSSPGRRRCS
jgi:hypothetical protein